ncbi:MAG: hypothetical protein IJ856_02060 [Candidatus Methanomethylophilaceae archaeon]|nr:hypothetical protein [Candidatus Methanomethylophilaceae archaeon]
MTPSAQKYNTIGVGAQLVEDYSSIYGFPFDEELVECTEVFEGGEIEIAGILFEVIPVTEAFEIVIPKANAVYMHMLGHDSHSLVFGMEGADAELKRLQGYLDRGIDLYLSSHHSPESTDDVLLKMDYIRDLKKTASESRNAEEFASKVLRGHHGFAGKDFVEMSSWFFFDI